MNKINANESYGNALGWCAFFQCLFCSTGSPQIEEGNKPDPVQDVEVVSGGLLIHIYTDNIEKVPALSFCVDYCVLRVFFTCSSAYVHKRTHIC